MWGWQVALYLFFGGLSAGSFAFAAVLQLAHGSRYGRTVRAVVFCSLAFLAVGVVLLLADVSMPLRALDVFRSFRNVETSWMARGVWVLMGCALLFLLYLLMAMLPFRFLPLLRSRREIVLNVVGVAGIFGTLLLAGYTGMLLSCTEGIPAWRTIFVPALFMVSSFDAGVAFGLLAFRAVEHGGAMRWVVSHRFDSVLLVLICLEIAVLVGYMVQCAPVGLSNAGSPALFATVLGLLLCAAASGAACFFLPRLFFWEGILLGSVMPIASAFLSLAAGVVLRFAVLSLGVHAVLI